jgi:DNA modification methylase
MNMNIVIDNEFKSLIPSLTDEEYAGLEASILEEGCRDALVLWGNILIDGHNRYEICTKHGIAFNTVQKDFDSRDDVMLWMIDTQRARRNLNEVDSILLAQKKTAILAEKAREKQLKRLKQNRSVQMDKTEKTINVREETAKEAGVSTGTIARFEQIQKKKPELIDNIRKGEVTIGKAYNAIKLEEKKEQIKKAERSIAEQASDECKPKLFVTDCRKATLKEKCDLLLTDPPYSTDVADIEAFIDSWLYKALDGVKDTGFAYIFIGAYPKELKAYLNAKIPKHMELCQQLIWTYKNTLGQNPKDRYKQNYQSCLFYRGVNAPMLDCPLTAEQWAVQEINAPDGRQGDRYHAWQKPMEIAERFIRHSTKVGDTVYDPFACTGTFLLASAKLGRKAFGCEIDPDNAAIAIERGCVYG